MLDKEEEEDSKGKDLGGMGIEENTEMKRPIEIINASLCQKMIVLVSVIIIHVWHHN